jgi:hypothetical protein
LAVANFGWMAWRIQDHVTHGEIDNRTKGVVRGKLWLHGADKPLLLELKGNAWPDLAGCILKLRNPGKTFSPPSDSPLVEMQTGIVGDLTASRKVRVPEKGATKLDESGKQTKRGPERLGNCVYLEWFSEVSGRVVLEGVDWELEISAPEWRLTPEEEKQRAKDAAGGMSGFLQKLTDAVEKLKQGQPDADVEWDEHDYERFLKQCDASGDKYRELLEKYGGSAEGEAIIEKEMGWGDEGKTEEELESQRQHIEEMNRITEEALNEPPAEPEPDPHREGIDWIRTPDGEIAHPLQHRCFESAMKFYRLVEELELNDEDKAHEFVFEFQTTGVKLGGALDSIAKGECLPEDAFIVAYLKRALNHLHKSQAALASAESGNKLPAAITAEARQELLTIRQGILDLMDRFRGRNR